MQGMKHNVSDMVSTGLKSTDFPIKHLAKFLIFSLF